MNGERHSFAFGSFILLSMCLALSSANAQINSTVVGPPEADKPISLDSILSNTIINSNMPVATQDQFALAEKLAAVSAPSGARAASSDASGGDAGGIIVDKPFVDEGQAFGTSTAPYTTRRVAVQVLGKPSSSAINTPVISYPFRATGKLYFKIANQNYICTAALIKKGLLVTAAHCVHDFGRGANGWYKDFLFCPANTDASGGVYGCYSAIQPRIATAWFNGSDTCSQKGVVCNNDVAVLNVKPKSGVYAGTVVGWYSYGWNGYSYRASSFLGNVTTVQIAQLGYPLAFDKGYQMQRTDAVGWYFASGHLKNTQIGSAQSKGSSGGPWLVNLGTKPSVSSAASMGSQINQAVVGVTSYGSPKGVNRIGSSFFGQNREFPNAAYGSSGAGNIGALVNAACTATPKYC